MTIRVQINDERFGHQLSCWIVDYDGDRPHRILRQTDTHGGFWEELEEHAIEVQPTFLLQEPAARALADALVRHFHGAEDTRALRRDYDAERARVDTQAQVIADVARTLAATRIGGTQ